MIKDSGQRQEFDSGAVRDIQKGKGRCDLMPLDVVVNLYKGNCNLEAAVVLSRINEFKFTNEVAQLYEILNFISGGYMFKHPTDMLLEVSVHFEEGAEKYGENNWQKGLPVWCYINSMTRHFLKWLRGDEDERHDRAFVWNILCCIWTVENAPAKTSKEGNTGNE